MSTTYIVWAYLDDDKGHYVKLFREEVENFNSPGELCEIRRPEGIELFNTIGTQLAMTLTPISEF